MATPSYGNIPLWNEPDTPCAGGAFDLDRAPKESATQIVDGWTVEVRAGAKLVVVRGGTEGTYEDAEQEALRRGQEGLDVLCVLGGDGVSISGAAERRFTWWCDAQHGPTLRVTSLASQGMTVGVVTVVTDAHGSLVPQPPEPRLPWHESFRYFRLSQTSDDLFDAYRNAFLALESVLSEIAPQRVNTASGGRWEGERDWFRRALTEANRLFPLAGHVPPGTADPIDFLFRELFESMRSAMSHSKIGHANRRLPRDSAERSSVADSLQRLVGIYLGLAAVQLGLHRTGGAVYAIFFRDTIEPLLADAIVHATDDESPENANDEVLNPAGGTLVPLTNEGVVDVSEPFRCSRFAYINTSDLRGLPFVRRVGVTIEDGTPFVCDVLEHRLVIDGLTRFEANIGVRGFNTRQPRAHYPL